MSKIFIAHRGNLTGPNKERENHPDYIMEAINAGYHCEIDVWKEQGQFLLGHDEPQYEIPLDFLFTPNLWVHAKNLTALHELIPYHPHIHCFFHDTDDCTLTTQGWIWTYPGRPLISNLSVAVMPERIIEEYDVKVAGGICSDYISEFKKNLKFKPNNAI
jgi:hypothetical protein